MKATERAAHDTLLTTIFVAMLIVLTIGGAGYLGWAWYKGDPSESTSRALNEGSQIEAAVKLYENENGGAQLRGTSIEEVHVLQNGGYLAGMPTGWRIDKGRPIKPLSSTLQCMQFNAAAGMDVSSHAVKVFEGCPPCESEDFAKYPACDREMAEPEAVERPGLAGVVTALVPATTPLPPQSVVGATSSEPSSPETGKDAATTETKAGMPTPENVAASAGEAGAKVARPEGVSTPSEGPKVEAQSPTPVVAPTEAKLVPDPVPTGGRKSNDVVESLARVDAKKADTPYGRLVPVDGGQQLR